MVHDDSSSLDEPFPLPSVLTGEKAGFSPFTNAPMYFRHSACHNAENSVSAAVQRSDANCKFTNKVLPLPAL